MPTIHTFGPFRLDPDTEILFRGAEPIPLGRRAVSLLRVLVERPGVPISKDSLIDAAWSGLAVEESNLTVQIAALRRVLGEIPGGEFWIETLPRRGYRFVGPIAKEDAEISRTSGPPGEWPTALALPEKPSIAVLPFESMSSDPEQEYFADGISEDIITALSAWASWRPPGGGPTTRSRHSSARLISIRISPPRTVSSVARSPLTAARSKP